MSHAVRSALLCRLVVCGWLLAVLVPTAPTVAQEVDLVDRPISAVQVDGLERVNPQLVRNQLRTRVGDPFDPQVVRGDIRRITRLGEFKFVDAAAQLLDDGSVEVAFQVVEQTIVAEVQVVGNKLIADQELLGVVRQFPGLARDDYLIEKAKRDMEDLYRKRGHYLTTISIDDSLLEETGVLLFRVIEGPRVKIKVIEFQGNDSFDAKQIQPEIKSRTAVPLFRQGAIDEDILTQDKAAIDRFYKARGFLDVRVDYDIQLSPDNKEAKLIFLIAEGRQYTLRRVQTRNALTGGQLEVYATEQIAALLEIRPGDVFGRDLLDESVAIIEDAYGRMGYLDARVRAYEIRNADSPDVTLLLEIDEGEYFKVGMVRIIGNKVTRDRIIRRNVRLQPGRPFDATEIQRSEQRIRATGLFGEPIRVTPQDPDPDDPEYRDVLVEVRERNTGSVNFGIALGSDAGLFGEFSVNQNNFDITDFPESFGELLRGAAFRGGGQRFSAVLRPGNELFQYSMSLTEPHLFETDYSLRGFFSLRARVFPQYDEDRFTLSANLGRRLGDIWDLGFGARFERVELSDLEPADPIEFFNDAGPNNITGISVNLTRTTIDSLRNPGKGSRFEGSFEKVGAFLGDFDYNVLRGDYTVYFTIDEDFLGRKSTLRLKSRVGYIFGPDDAPTYERFYLGGRSLRGFEFRSIGPKGTRADNGEPSDEVVGGEWQVFLGAQYQFPLVQQVIAGVVFIDSGTVLDEPGFDEYRVAIGAGIRLTIPALGPAPLAFDFAVPLAEEEGDETEVFSFTAELPF